MSILDLAGTLSDALIAADIPYALTVVRQETVDPDTPWDPSDDTTEDVPHTCSGWVDTWDAQDIDGTLILQTDRKVFVLASTLDIEPSVDDMLAIDGTPHFIQSVSRDPAGACWILQARL